GGLGWTDSGDKNVIGGLALEFYQRVYQHYQDDDAWPWQERDKYGNRAQGTPAMDGSRAMWVFEPHVAEQTFEAWVREYGVPVHRDRWLDRAHGIAKEGARITSITTLDGRTYRGRMFIDATYEGDLMAAAGVDYHVGRESIDTYGEEWNGVQTGVLHHSHHFADMRISPYRSPGDPASGLLPRINPDHPGEYGAGDDKIQAYCFRMCLTDHPDNRVPFAKPANYDPDQYELLARVFGHGWDHTFRKFDPLPNRKTDTNNHGPFNTDNIGYNYDYPEATYERRREIIQEHEDYQKGLMYFIATDPRVPEKIQTEMNRWGLAKDEFVDNGHWPHQLYIREARRMVGAYVMTENELLKKRPTPDPVGMGSYTMDSHNVQRYITPEGHVQNEGDIGVSTRGAYQIAYGSITPQKRQAQNLLVPVCVSSSHIAFGSIRMEPVFMILGQSATTAAAMAIDAEIAVQDVPYEKLQQRLIADGQVLTAPAGSVSRSQKSVDPGSVGDTKRGDVVLDDTHAKTTGYWSRSTSSGTFIGDTYRHDSNTRDGQYSARFETKLTAPGRYECLVAYTPHANRATNALVRVEHAGGVTEKRFNQRVKPPVAPNFVSLGEFDFTPDRPAAITVSNEGADGYVIIDAVWWRKK
ncbi:MAG: FAD-dependent oxidoreductase, partial [Planctomycetota bacterium]